MAWVGSLLLLALALGSSWLARELWSGLPFSDKSWFTVIGVLLWAGFVWCLDRAINPRRCARTRTERLVGSLLPPEPRSRPENHEPPKVASPENKKGPLA